ncbi:MAG: magnesium transporter [Lachnospiraceae bacterium]|nr:magnesium transporter [Lachnospiraceae bacterium]MBQ2402101.1 magnesium transporter [Lachnospiraceae bacterium]MBQ5660842.1 magnesium transporter [Lachnospiraceae bacterium]MBQ5698559.1 magnesium transporter [Lachnospiraceae bacterium]MBQ5870695.1 magnesium transporter [Lachnospiraceae bacterium]
MENFDLEELLELVNAKKYRQLKEALLDLNEVDIALFMDELDSVERTMLVFRMLPKEMASEVFAELDPESQEDIINSITDRELSEIVEDLYVDDAVDMLEEMPATIVRRVMENTKPETRKLINQFLNYPENSAGSIMTAEYIGLKKHMTVEESFAFIRKHGIDSETIYTCYVMDSKRRLEGVVTVRNLIMNPYDAVVGDIMDDNVIKAITTMDQEEVVEMMNKYDLLSMPVVDSEDRLVGIITVDDVMDVMEEEATEDIEKMAAMLPSEKPYLRTGVFELAKNRIPWLLFLMLSSTLSGAILERYENAFAAIPLLVSFTPMLMNTGGNSGSQSSAMIIRGMSLGEIEPTDILRVIWKEVRVGLIAGIILAVCNFIRLMIQYPGNTMISLVVVLSVFVTVVIAKTIGCTLPIAAKVLKADPAIMAGPLITTIVDAVSLIVYFNLACMLLDMTV